MRRALGELDRNTPIANRRSPRQCNARARDETPVRTRAGRRRWRGRHSSECSETALDAAAALDAAEVLKNVRENWRNHYSRYAETHLTYAEALIVWRGGVVRDARR